MPDEPTPTTTSTPVRRRHAAALDVLGDHAAARRRAGHRAGRHAVRPAARPRFVLDADHLQAVIYSAVALGLGLLVGRAGMFSLCQIPLFAAGAWIALRARPDRPTCRSRSCCSSPACSPVCSARHRHPGAAAQRPVPRAHHADGRRCAHVGAAEQQVPQRRRRVLGFRQVVGVRRDVARPAVDRHRRHRLLPLRRHRGRAAVPVRHLAHQGQAGPGLGGHPPEPGHRRRGRGAHHAVQAVGVRACRRSSPASPVRCSLPVPAVSASTSSPSSSRSCCWPWC